MSAEKPVENSNQQDSNPDPIADLEQQHFQAAPSDDMNQAVDGSYQHQQQYQEQPLPPQWDYGGDDGGIKFHEPGAPDLGSSPQGWQQTLCPRWHGRSMHSAHCLTHSPCVPFVGRLVLHPS